MGRKGTAAIGRWAMAIIPAVPVLLAGIGKLTDRADWEARFVNWGLPTALSPVIGVAEIVGAVLLLVPKTRFYGAAVVIGIMLGAVVTHVAAGEYAQAIPSFALAGIAAIAGWWARPVWFHELVVKEKPEAPPEPGQSRRKPKS